MGPWHLGGPRAVVRAGAGGGGAPGAICHVAGDGRADGPIPGDLNIDVLAFALGKPSIDAGNEELAALLDGPRPALAQALTEAGDIFRREVVVRTDAGDAALAAWTLPGLPEVEAALARKIEPRILIAGDITVSGTLPAGAHSISIRLPYVLGETVFVYVVPGGQSYAQLVPAGDYSGVVNFELSSNRARSAVSSAAMSN